tara:strand:- start:3640 stop:4479 length:840 start_codon:yes stop_codon:yes gene_type:complete
MFFFQFDYKKIAIITLLIILPLFSISLLKPGDRLWIFRPLSHVVGFSQSMFVGFTNAIKETTSTYIDLIAINKENQQLHDENAILKAQMLAFNEIKQENLRLREILNFQQQQDYNVNPAQVIGVDIFAERSTLRINKGEKHGVKKGDAVITQDAVVGYILEAHNLSSVVLVLTDRYSVIDAVLQTSRARGIVEGIGVDSCRLKYLQRSDEVNVGDLVVTSGLDNIFPKGIPIARVKSVSRKKSEITPNVELSPVVDITRLDEVLVINNVNNQSLEAALQ